MNPPRTGYIVFLVDLGVFPALEAEPTDTALGVVPIENSRYGAVIETLDALLNPVMGSSIFVRGEYEFPISHSLVVRKGVTMRDIRIVASHPQVRHPKS